MSFNLQQGSFIYHGDAFGVSARFEHPNRMTVPTQAQAILAPTGGEAFSSVKNFNFQDAVMFDEAMARAVGSQDPDGSYHTDVSATIRNLRFLQVHADFVNARVTSVHRVRETRAGVIDEADVMLTGCAIQNLFVAGQKIDLEFDTEVFARFPTFELLRKGDPKRGKVYAHGGVKDGLVRTSIVSAIGGVPQLSASERKTLMNDANATLSGVRFFENVILVPQFGKIFVGEVIIERGYRRINMLRIELGCGTGGGGTVGGGTGNGGDIPPDRM